MANYKYLIVGGGMAADAAVNGIRQVDPDGLIGLMSEEGHPPYNRPPLTKGLWKGKRLESIWRKAANEDAICHLGRRAVTLDPVAQIVTDDRGAAYSFQQLLLATGGRPRRLPVGGDEIVYYRGLDDYHRLRALADLRDRFAVIGGGFIGSELAAALVESGKQVHMIFPEEGIGSRLFPRDLSLFLNDYYTQKGVDVLPGENVVGLEPQEDHLLLVLGSGRRLEIDGVVAGVGIEPNVELAKNAGLHLDNGIAVDPSLRTSSPNIFAAGDVASFLAPALGRRIRVEHEDNANHMGRAAGRSMAGQVVSYDYLPFFYSDLFDLGYEAIGEIDARLETVADWHAPMQEGIVYYLRDRQVRGVLLWNVWEQIEAARDLIASGHSFQPGDLLHRLPA